MATDPEKPWPDAPLLIVDDDQSWVTALNRALRSMGWKDVRSLTDPQHTVAIASEFRPAVILLDLRIAGKDGLNLLEDLQTNLPQVPVIIVTSIENVDLAVDCMRRGACHYLVKPLCRDKLGEALNIALAEGRHNHDAHPGGTEITNLAELPPLHEVKDLLIEEALRRSDGTLSEAANMLGVTPQAICNWRRRVANAEDAEDDAENENLSGSPTSS